MKPGRAGVAVLACVLAAALVGCRSSAPRPVAPAMATPGDGAVPPPPYGDFVDGYNARVARLGRLWANAVITMRFVDGDGDRRMEQGRGHLQLLDRRLFALDVGKLGETLVWFGCDGQRYWLIDRTDRSTVFVGRHELATQAKMARVGLPVAPRQLLTLAGLTPLPPGDSARSVRTGWSDSGGVWVVAGDETGEWWYELPEPSGTPADAVPTRIVRRDAEERVVLVSELDRPESVRLADPGGAYPVMPTRIRVQHPASDAMITIDLDGRVTDGVRRDRPARRAFDLATLVDALGPFERVIDLDEEAERG